jgi:hypothetical protein
MTHAWAVTEWWETTDELAAARRRFTEAIDGYEPAAICGVGRVGTDGGATFSHVNVVAEHRLPAVVLATVCGHVRGAGSYSMTAADLDRAIDLLAPAEACTAVDHPNLREWRALRAEPTESSPPYVVVFVADLAAPSIDRFDEALREGHIG